MNTFINNSIVSLIIAITLNNPLHAIVINPHASFEIKNIKTGPKSLEFDIYLQNDGKSVFQISAFSLGINLPYSAFENENITFDYIEGSRSKELENLSDNHLQIVKFEDKYQFALTGYPIEYTNTPKMNLNQVVKIGRFRISNLEKQSYFRQSNIQVQKQFKKGLIQTVLLAYIGTDGTLTAMNNNSNYLNVTIENNYMEYQNNMNYLPFSIYPNPVTERMYIEMLSTKEAEATCNIFNFEGQMVYSSKLQINKGLNRSSIDISKLLSGAYLLEIRYADIQYKKMIQIL